MREVIEANLLRHLRAYLRHQRARAVEAFKLGLELDWGAEEGDLTKLLTPILVAATLDGIQSRKTRIEDLTSRGINIARLRARDVSRMVTRTTAGVIAAALRDARILAEGLTLEEIAERIVEFGRQIDPAFTESRALSIAATEITRAASDAAVIRLDQLRRDGFEVVLVWQTDRDELVCEVCAPLDDKEQGDGWTEPPPAHINCRCGTITVFRE